MVVTCWLFHSNKPPDLMKHIKSSLILALCVCEKLLTLQKETVAGFHTLGSANEHLQTIGLITLKCQPTHLPIQVLIEKRQRGNEGRFFRTPNESSCKIWLVKPCVCAHFFLSGSKVGMFCKRKQLITRVLLPLHLYIWFLQSHLLMTPLETQWSYQE